MSCSEREPSLDTDSEEKKSLITDSELHTIRRKSDASEVPVAIDKRSSNQPSLDVELNDLLSQPQSLEEDELTPTDPQDGASDEKDVKDENDGNSKEAYPGPTPSAVDGIEFPQNSPEALSEGSGTFSQRPAEELNDSPRRNNEVETSRHPSQVNLSDTKPPNDTNEAPKRNTKTPENEYMSRSGPRVNSGADMEEPTRKEPPPDETFAKSSGPRLPPLSVGSFRYRSSQSLTYNNQCPEWYWRMSIALPELWIRDPHRVGDKHVENLERAWKDYQNLHIAGDGDGGERSVLTESGRQTLLKQYEELPVNIRKAKEVALATHDSFAIFPSKNGEWELDYYVNGEGKLSGKMKGGHGKRNGCTVM